MSNKKILFLMLCYSNDIIQSMRRKENSWDNVLIEKYFNKLKNEFVYFEN
jgi:transposase InsO family protein